MTETSASAPPDLLDPEQVDGLLDMDPERFRAAAHVVVDRIADYLANVESYPVLPPIEPGTIGPRLPAHAPEAPEPMRAILADIDALVFPNATHWQHPGFFAYFATSASGPGMLGEFLTAALGQNPMLWRTSPIGTELESVVVRWLREGLGLPEAFDGLLTDTASTSTLIALGAAREAAGLEASARGLAGREDVAQVRVYASEEAHSSIEKACMTLGLGRDALVKIRTNDRYEMDADRAGGRHRRGPRRRAAAHRHRGDRRDDVVHLRRPRGGRGGHRGPRGPVAARRLRVRRRRRPASGSARPVRRLGACQFDRHQPAQVAVHPAGRLACCSPGAWTSCARRSAWCPSTCAPSTA